MGITLENSLAISFKVKNIVIMKFSSSTHTYLPKRKENITPQKACTQMFLATLLVTDQTENNLNGQLTGE